LPVLCGSCAITVTILPSLWGLFSVIPFIWKQCVCLNHHSWISSRCPCHFLKDVNLIIVEQRLRLLNSSLQECADTKATYQPWENCKILDFHSGWRWYNWELLLNAVVFFFGLWIWVGLLLIVAVGLFVSQLSALPFVTWSA
jgi:hypothetical protein